MASPRRSAAVLLVAMVAVVMFQLIQGAVYKVGDSAGWTTIGNPDYKQWAATKTFRVGDVIVFSYNPQFHNVMRVTHATYRACNASDPIATFTTGNDSITITTHGHHYFFCGVPGHCLSGQKVDINVLREGAMAPGPSSSTAGGSGSVPSARVPGPAPNGAMSLKASAPFGTIGLTMAAIGIILLCI